MEITKDKNNLIIKIPLTQKQNNCYMEDEERFDVPAVCGYIEIDKNGHKRLGFSYVIDLDYKGSTQYSGIFLEYYPMCSNPPIEEFEKLCQKLGLDIAEDYTEEIPYSISKWISTGKKRKYFDYMAKMFSDKFSPEIEDHLTCGNENCFYDGKWCYHLTDKEWEEMINFLKTYTD